MEMPDEVLSSVVAREIDTSGYQVSDLKVIEFHWEDPDLIMHAVVRPNIVFLFSPSTFNDFETGSMAENPILFDEEQHKENFPPLPTAPVSERPNQRPVLMRSRPFGPRSAIFPQYFCRKLFHYFVLSLMCMYLHINSK